MKNWISRLAALGLMVGISVPAGAGTFQIYSSPADNTIIAGPPGEGNVLQATSASSVPGDYAGISYQVTTPALTFTALTQLSALYEMTTGTFGGGSPRFTLFDSSTNGSADVYWGTTPGGGAFTDPHPGVYASTGNLVDPLSTAARFAFNTFTFGSASVSPNTYYDYAQFSALVGTQALSYITLDLDGGFTGTQVMITDEFTVSTASTNEVYEVGPDQVSTPEPTSITLLSIGLAAIAGYGWRRKNLQTVA